eukprot:COSAG05_NODE_16501_length_344_cov_3.665306_1_plen_27_part_01
MDTMFACAGASRGAICSCRPQLAVFLV